VRGCSGVRGLRGSARLTWGTAAVSLREQDYCCRNGESRHRAGYDEIPFDSRKPQDSPGGAREIPDHAH